MSIYTHALLNTPWLFGVLDIKKLDAGFLNDTTILTTELYEGKQFVMQTNCCLMERFSRRRMVRQGSVLSP